jgi:plasmid stabilization system protein ParE
VTRYQVSLLPLAEEEIKEAFHWYSERSAFAADAFRAEVFAAVDSLAEDPTMWPADAEGVRHYILRRFPYTLHYAIAASDVTVFAVAHQRRRPGYWHER